MEYRFKPQNVCSSEMIFDIENDIIKEVKIIGGCAGNTEGISRLLRGMNINLVIEKLKGTRCGKNDTSCPDQLAKALELYKNR